MAQAQPATTQHSAENNSVTTRPSLPELSVVLFNVHSCDSVTATDRKRCLSVILDSVPSEDFPDPLFVLCQENINGPKHKIVCRKLSQDPKTVPYKEEAGVYYRAECTGQRIVCYVEASTLERIARNLEPNVLFVVDRLMACILITPASPQDKILLLSWHGPETIVKKNIDQKVVYFRKLIDLSERLRREVSCDIVLIGGDFNLPDETAKGIMNTFREEGVDGVVTGPYEQPADRQNQPIKDFIVYWPQNRLQNIQTSVIRPEYRRRRGNRPFDHPIVGFKFGINADEASAQPEE